MTKKFPIAEMFDSVQGEGLWTGTRMFFIRFAGCSVGKKMTGEERRKFGGESFPLYRETCTLYDGRKFPCDTNFQTAEALTLEQIYERIPSGVNHICLTGGEPLNQPLGTLLDLLSTHEAANYKVHIETSGTVSLEAVYPDYGEDDIMSGEPDDYDFGWMWIAVSPKYGVLDEMIGIASEIKLLVDEDFDLAKVPEDVKDHRLVWLQPVNDEFKINQDNLKRCLLLMKEHPNFRLSTQAHKIWNVR